MVVEIDNAVASFVLNPGFVNGNLLRDNPPLDITTERLFMVFDRKRFLADF